MSDDELFARICPETVKKGKSRQVLLYTALLRGVPVSKV